MFTSKQLTLNTYVQTALLEETSHDNILMASYRVVDQICPSFGSKDPRGHVFTPHSKAPETTKTRLKTCHIKVKGVFTLEQRVKLIGNSESSGLLFIYSPFTLAIHKANSSSLRRSPKLHTRRKKTCLRNPLAGCVR